MRHLMRLVEASMPPDDEDEDESKYDSLPASTAIKPHLVEICAAVQKIYDHWDQSDPDNDELNGGGICHLIADEIASILNSNGMIVTTQSSYHEQHVYCVGQFQNGIFEIDIPHRLYERGGGFTWHKLPGVQFEPSDIQIVCLSSNPSKMGEFVEDWEEYYGDA